MIILRSKSLQSLIDILYGAIKSTNTPMNPSIYLIYLIHAWHTLLYFLSNLYIKCPNVILGLVSSIGESPTRLSILLRAYKVWDSKKFLPIDVSRMYLFEQ